MSRKKKHPKGRRNAMPPAFVKYKAYKVETLDELILVYLVEKGVHRAVRKMAQFMYQQMFIN